MSQETGKFTISYSDLEKPTFTVGKDGIYIGRLDTCEIVLDHKTVSRIHAGINFRDGKYFVINLSTSNVLTLNGRLLGAQKDDILADGDTIQIGPFTLTVGRFGDDLLLIVESQFSEQLPKNTGGLTPKPATPKTPPPTSDGVLKVFWEKRNREKDDWGTRLRPTEKPMPGKAMFNWRPTGDLRRPWRFGLFVWAFLLIGAVGAFAFLRYPQTYAPKPLSNPHAQKIEGSTIAAASNGNSCTTCHTPNEPLENSCVKCHQGTEFHASNTKAHEQAGITCTVCHKEHQGADFQITATAIQSCAECHNDNNSKTYNSKSVRTAHAGSYGYPIVEGVWKWKGVYKEVADAIPEINNSATGDKDEQARLSRQFHTIHVARLKVPAGVKGDSKGLVSCSSCHISFDPIDRTTPRQTCSACHTTAVDAVDRDSRFGSVPANCISCHVQHPYSAGRWSEFLTPDALTRRKDAVVSQIKRVSGQ
ncbi:MAG: FHA domain-containing protein [Pyrinomonadaceae bacterium]